MSIIIPTDLLDVPVTLYETKVVLNTCPHWPAIELIMRLRYEREEILKPEIERLRTENESLKLSVESLTNDLNSIR